MISIPFNQFVESYKKLDKSLFYKFFSNFDLYPETDKEYAEIFEFSDDQSPLFLLENLKTSNNSSESFEKHCFDNLLTEISENFQKPNTLQQNSEDFKEQKPHQEFLNKKFYSSEEFFYYIENENQRDLNIFYGEFEVIRISTILSFDEKASFCEKKRIFSSSDNKWQNVLFELLFELKSSLNPDLSNLSSLFIRLNELNTKALPNYFCALVLFNILNNQREDFNVFLNS